MQFHARYYVVALFFVLFDVEAVFLFPWSVVRKELGANGLGAAFAFIAVLMLGWLYAVRKEALRWQ
jgi:NADH-quinone oxidoreductase subunit A